MNFDEQKHEYTHNNIKYTSVTELIRKYGLSANYDGVPPDVLAKAAARGKATHKSLENYVKGDRSELNITSEVDLLHNYVQTRAIDLTTAKSEEIVYDDTYHIAGTVDFQFVDGPDRVIADFKTTSQLHVDAVAWQLSIYNFILSKGDIMTYYFNKLKVFHYTTSKLYVKDIYLVDYDAVKQLLEANQRGDATFNYVKPNVVVAPSDEQLIGQILTELMTHKEVVDKLEGELNTLLEKVKVNMVNSNDYTYSNDTFLINYVHPQQRKSLDTNKIKQYLVDQGEDVNDYMKESTTKDGVKATLRK
jgi:hypothetical protein